MAWIGNAHPADSTRAQHVFVQQMIKNVKSKTACLVDLKHPSPIPADLKKNWDGFILIHDDASKLHNDVMSADNSKDKNSLVFELNDMMVGTLGGNEIVDKTKRK